jgi:hypothetical protein
MTLLLLQLVSRLQIQTGDLEPEGAEDDAVDEALGLKLLADGGVDPQVEYVCLLDTLILLSDIHFAKYYRCPWPQRPLGKVMDGKQ